MQNIDTSISVMVNSGLRGDISNIKLASAMIGIMVDASNREIELPIRSNFKQGLSSLEAFVATRGSRKGLIDTALKTADSGYLTLVWLMCLRMYSPLTTMTGKTKASRFTALNLN